MATGDDAEVTVYGAAYSVYVRVVRLTLAEKGVPYALEEVDIFAEEGPPAGYERLHPFAKIPAFDHAGFRLYETGAIARYVDRTFPGPALMPAERRAAARVDQLIAIVDAYAYPAMVWGVYVPSVSEPREGKPRDEPRIADGLRRSERCLHAIEALRTEDGRLLGGQLTLADLFLAPVIGYFLAAEEAGPLWGRFPGLQDWWRRMRAREAMRRTCSHDMAG